MDSCYQMFDNAIQTDATRLAYSQSLEKFKNFSKVKTYCQLTKLKTPKLKKLLISYISYLKEKELRSTSISLYLSSVELFLDMNEVSYPKRVIRKTIPKKGKKQGGDRPYTTDEVKRMLASSTKLRTKAIIHIFASTGMRPNGLHDPPVTLGDIVELPDGTKSALIYADSDEEYWTFFTQEAVRAIDDYILSRKLNGEHLDTDSPLIENNGKAIGYRAIRHILTRVMKNAGIKRVKTGNRYDKALTYGFRKRFNTILKISENSINPNIAEKLIAHKRGLDGTYLKPTMEECHREFAKAIVDLAIDPAERQRIEIKRKQERITELEQQQDTIEDQQMEITEMKKRQEKLEKMWMEKSFPGIEN